MWLHEVADADAACGGKAVGLARLIAAGVPVPAGFVLDGRAFRALAGLELAEQAALPALEDVGHALAAAAARLEHAELPAELERDVCTRAAALGAYVVVRSSATIEDGAAGAAAGVFASERGVPSGDVWAAIRAVWTSALAPLAAAYARRRASAIQIGVIVQALAPGELVTVYTRPPGEPDSPSLLVQRGDVLAREPRAHPSATGALALRAEAAIGATTGADVELAGTVVVQARPIVHPVRRPRPAPPPILLAPLLHDGRVWTWDVAHNPDPLSPAQAGLVERVERAGLGAYALRVCAGYLYATPRDDRAAAPVTSVAELDARATAITARLDAALAGPAISVADAIARYLACYALWANELAPLVASARAELARDRSIAAPVHRPSSVEATLAHAARGELAHDAVVARLGDLAPAWDVAVPAFGETPSVLRDAIARAAPLAASHAPSPAASFAASAADLAERDDVYFARMQQLVRRALLARSAELGLAGDDIFWLALDDASAPIDPAVAHRRAAAARAATDRAAAWDMPLVVGDAPAGTPRLDDARRALHGVGTGPRVVGRVVRFASLAGAAFVGAGDVVVVRAVTPALAMFVGRCAAIVSETGGLLDHGAALARELGIPCVVGCHHAWSELADGMIVTVDGDAGTVQSSS